MKTLCLVVFVTILTAAFATNDSATESMTTSLMTDLIMNDDTATGNVTKMESTTKTPSDDEGVVTEGVVTEGVVTVIVTETQMDTISCYVCSSKEDANCLEEQPDSSKVEDCGGYCWASVFLRDGADIVNVTRTCASEPCSSMHEDGFFCQMARGIQLCTYCCETDECNTGLSGAAHLNNNLFLTTLLSIISGMQIIGHNLK